MIFMKNSTPQLAWQAGRFVLDLQRPRIMGIVNCTPDSFSDGGQFADSASAIAQAAVELYQNPQAWHQAQQLGQTLLTERYLQASHGPALVQRIEACRADLEQHRRNNFTGAMLRHHQHKSTQYMSQWIEAKNRSV